MLRGLNGSYVLRDCLAAGVAEALDAGWEEKDMGLLERWFGSEGKASRAMPRSLGFTGKGVGSPGSPFELGGDLVLVRHHRGSVEDGM